MLQLLKDNVFHCTIHILDIFCWICLVSPLHSCRTIKMDFILNVKTFLFMHVEITWLLFIPVFFN